jgi:hypothetical protein
MNKDQQLLNQRATKVLTSTGGYVVVSIGFIILSFVLPAIHDGPATPDLKRLFMTYGQLFFAYVVATLLCYLFARKFIFTLNFLTRFIYLPIVGLFFMYHAYLIFMEYK